MIEESFALAMLALALICVGTIRTSHALHDLGGQSEREAAYLRQHGGLR